MSRELFEKWARLKGYSCTVREKQYLDSATRMVDEAWQACAEEKDKRIAELDAENQKLAESLLEMHNLCGEKCTTISELTKQNKELVEALEYADKFGLFEDEFISGLIFSKRHSIRRLKEALAKAK